MFKYYVKSPISFQFTTAILLIVALWFPAFVGEIDVVNNNAGGFLYRILVDNLLEQKLLASIVALVIVVGLAIYTNYIFFKTKIIGAGNFLPILLVVFLYSWNSAYLTVSPELIASVFIIPGVGNILQFYDKEKPYQSVLSSSFLFSLASLFYSPFIFSLIIVLISVIIVRISEWRPYLIAIVGFVLPYLYLIPILYINDSISVYYNYFSNDILNLGLSTNIEVSAKAWIIVHGVIFVLALISVIGSTYESVLKYKRKQYLVMFYMLFVIIFGFISNVPLVEYVFLTAIPFIFYFINIITYNKKSTMFELLLFLLIAYTIVMNIIGYFIN